VEGPLHLIDGYLDYVTLEKTGFSNQTGQPTVGFTAARTMATYTRDAMGRVTHYFEQGGFDGSYERTNIQYDAAGRELSETNITMRRDTTGGTMQTYTTYLSNSYSNGLLTGQYQDNWKGTSDTDVADVRLSYGYQWWDGAQQQTIGNDNDANGTVDWTTTYSYDPSGRAGSVYIADGKPRGVSLATDQNGMIIDRTEAAQGGSPRTLRYVFGGVQMGEVGNNGTDNMSFAASVADRLVIQPTPTAAGPFHNGATSGTQFADFDQSYDAINGLSDAGTGSTYVAAAGDTLQSIAAMVWGDASLWYLIADANGMSGAEQIQAGRSLTIPDVVANVHNNATTFRPYDPTRAIGDVSPGTPKPVKNHHGCGIMGAVLLVAVAVAVAVVTSGAAVALFGPAGTSLGTGIATVLGTSGGLAVGGAAAVAAGGISTGAFIAAGAIGGAVGSAVSQGLGVATGLQDKFDWKAVALAAIAGGVGAGLGPNGAFGKLGAFGKIGSPVLAAGLRGATASAITQGIGLAAGLQRNFDWVGVAAAGIGAGAASAVGGIKGLNSLGRFGDHLATNMAGGIANAAARSVLNGTDFGDNLLAALPDVLGETLGNMIASGVSGAISLGSASALVHEHPSTPEPDFQVDPAALTAGSANVESLLQPLPDLSESSTGVSLDTGVHAMDTLPNGASVGMRRNADGTWDTSTFAFFIGGKRQAPTMINQDFAFDGISEQVYHPTVVGGDASGRSMDVRSGPPQVRYDADGHAFVYVFGDADFRTLVPVKVRVLSALEVALRGGASEAANYVPMLGTSKALGELISGRDAYTGRPVSRVESGVGAIASLIPFLRGGGRLAAKVATTRAERIAIRAELNALRRLTELEASTGGHFLAKHGAETTLAQQLLRATTGLAPDGTKGVLSDASRFLTNTGQMNAISRANTIFRQTGRASFTFDMGEVVGEGYLRGGGQVISSSRVTAVFRNGKLVTIFPKLRR